MGWGIVVGGREEREREREKSTRNNTKNTRR